VVQQLLLLPLLLSSQLQASTSPALLRSLQPSTSVHSNNNSNNLHPPAIPLALHLQQPQPLGLQHQPLVRPPLHLELRQQRLQHLELFSLHHSSSSSSNSSRPSALGRVVRIVFRAPGESQLPGELGSNWKIVFPQC